MNQRIIFMGTPAFAVASLNSLVNANLEVAAVVTAPDRPAGRGRHLRMSPVKERALELGLSILQPEKLKAPEFLAQLDALDASLYIVVAFRMLPEVVWGRPARGTVNLHASLLPDYRGAAPINWAIINGEQRTGLTTFLINDRIDTGDILLREVVAIAPDENAEMLHDRMKDTGATLLLRTVKDLLDGTVTSIPQVRFEGDDVHQAPKLTPENCRIDWTRSAQQVHDQVRGLSPLPGAWTILKEPGQPDRKFKLIAARRVAESARKMAPGAINVHDDQLLIGCGTGCVQAMEVQLEGKRQMDARSFLNGIRHRGAISVE